MSDQKQIALVIDHTNIQPEAKTKDIRKTCKEAKKFGFRSVVVNPKHVKKAKAEVAGTPVKVGVLIDPPMGLSSHKKRLKLCQKAKLDGADELDVVMNVVDLKHERYDTVLADLKEICQIAPTKVIIGSGYLTDDEIKKASELVKEAGAICVKTATFKDPLENREIDEKARHVRIMKESAPGLLVKASGNIKTLKDVEAVLAAGADIVGTSGGVDIIQEIKAADSFNS